MKQYKMPGQSDKEVPCSDHVNAPHGFNRNASHGNNRYTCECEGWEEEMIAEVIDTLEYEKERCIRLEYVFSVAGIEKQIKFMQGLKK
jgi:hypothetical protein